MLSNNRMQDQIMLTTPPFTNQFGNSYFNVVLFVILHVLCGSLVLFILLPCKNIYFKSSLVLDSHILPFVYIGFFCLLMGSFGTLVFSDPGYVMTNNSSLVDLIDKKIKINEYCPVCIVS
jgi:hypothetical protein